MRAIQGVEHGELAGAGRRTDLRRRFQVEYGRSLAANLRALIDRREPAGSPVLNAIDRQPAGIAQHHIARQILAFASPAINPPPPPPQPPTLPFPTSTA